MPWCSPQTLREDLLAMLMEADTPRTTGDFTRELNARGVKVSRYRVRYMLDAMVARGEASCVVAPCIRNARWVAGRHYMLASTPRPDVDPFDGLDYVS
jgi:hypothetical protein